MMKVVILIGRMRSGTTALREVLQSNLKIAQLGEIFHSDYINDDRFYYNYFLRRVKQDPTLALPSGERRALFVEYIAYLKERLELVQNGKAVLILGVNYNSLHSLNYYWQHPLSPPYLLEILRSIEYPVIHIIRRNLLETLISEWRARKTGVWHIKNEAQRSDTRIALDIPTLISELEERDAEIRLVQRWLAGYPHLLELEYEDTFRPDNKVSDAVLARCASFLGVPNEVRPTVGLRRTAPATLAQAVSNYDDVVQVLSTSRFSHFLGDMEKSK